MLGDSVGTLSVISVTHRGYRRRDNEDSVLVGTRILSGDFETWKQDFSLSEVVPLVIADGLGGHRGGQIASGFVINELSQRFKQLTSARTLSFSQILNELSLGLSIQMGLNPEVTGMGSTVVLACVEPSALTFVNVGDSRAYFFDLKGLTQISVDDVPKSRSHSERSPQSAAITQALGGTAAGIKTIVPHIKSFEFPMEEWSILLCSDGITDYVPDTDISQALVEDEFDVMTLVDQALAAGGFDNISAIVAKFRPLVGKNSQVSV